MTSPQYLAVLDELLSKGYEIFRLYQTLVVPSDTKLDEIVESMTSLHPESGEKSVSGRLQSQGICVQRERIRESLCRVDPGGV